MFIPIDSVGKRGRVEPKIFVGVSCLLGGLIHLENKAIYVYLAPSKDYTIK